MPKTFFMVGTDTGVGTTFTSCAILQAAKNAGFASFAMQPISVGCEQTEQGLRGRDPLQLMQVFSEKPLRDANKKDLGRRTSLADQTRTRERTEPA